MYGVALAYLRLKKPDVWNMARRCWPLGVFGLLAATAYWIFITKTRGGLSVASFMDRVLYVNVISCSLLLIMPRLLDLADHHGWISRVIHKISLWSYSLYLSHTIILDLVTAMLARLMPPFFGFNVVASVLTWMGAILISAALYRFYEKPIMDLRDRPLRKLWRSPD